MQRQQKPVHLVHKISQSGDISPLCAVRPRKLNLNREIWTLAVAAVTCPQCQRRMAASPEKYGNTGTQCNHNWVLPGEISEAPPDLPMQARCADCGLSESRTVEAWLEELDRVCHRMWQEVLENTLEKHNRN